MFLTSAAIQNPAKIANDFNTYFNLFSLGANTYIVGLIYTIIPIVAYWYLFEKKGEPGWKVLIPFYGSYIQFKLFFNTGKFWRQFIASIFIFVGMVILGVGVIFSYAGSHVSDRAAFTILLGFLVMIVSAIWAIVISIQYDIAICKKYGRGFWFILGMIFLTPIFIGALAYEVYKGRIREVEDTDDIEESENVE